MKIKGLLIVLPALMVLAGCSNKPIATKNEFVEDTLAHEEIFGGFSAQKHELGKQMPSKLKGDGEFYKPVLFWQQKDNNDGTKSIRFVAAIEDEATTAVWTRSVHTLNGEFRKEKGNVEVTTVYETIDVSTNPAQENRRSATDIESEEDKTKPFSYFAVYCLLNIPQNAEEYYLDAYLTVSNDTKTKTSDVGSLNVVNQSKHFKYSLGDEEKYICEINDSVGTCTFIESDELEGTNRFNKKDCTLGSDNNFVIHCYIFNNTILSYTATTYGYDDIRESDSFEEGENGEIASIYDGGTYVITLTNSYEIQIKKLYFFEGDSSWWDNGEDTIAELIKYGDEGTLITGGYLHFDSYDGEDLIYVGYVEDDSIYNQIRFRIGDQSTEFVYTPYTGLPYYIQADEDWG